MTRTLIGLSVGSGLEGIDAAVVRAGGIGLDLTPRVEAAARVPFPPAVRDVIRFRLAGADAPSIPPEFTRNLADTAVYALRQLAVKAGVSPRDVFAAGLLEPARPAADVSIPWPDIVDRVAEQTGLTVFHAFRSRDRAAGGSGHPITAVADYALFRHPTDDRLMVHLGAVSSLVFIPAGAKVSALLGFEAGPGNQLLDALVYHGTRGREATDPGGKKAVQGRCVDQLLARWLEHPHLTRKPPKAVHPDAFGKGFLLSAFEAAKQLGVGLPDLLCTATHYVARAIGAAVRAWLPPAGANRRVYLSGGGVRNGLLWQRVCRQFDGLPVGRLDEIGVGATACRAAGAAVLAALSCDGVAGNLPLLTGAAGGRLLGHIAPGDGRNWAKVAAWIADQTGEYPRANRAA